MKQEGFAPLLKFINKMRISYKVVQETKKIKANKAKNQSFETMILTTGEDFFLLLV
jgi:hypothetical protein